MSCTLIADSGATKCSWYLLENNKKKKIRTGGLSPYFMSIEDIKAELEKSLLPKIKKKEIDQIFFYGAGLAADVHKKAMTSIFKKLLPTAKTTIASDLVAAARATCGTGKGVVSILGTGSGSAYYNGKRIQHEQNGIGYILGDEGSGAYLGKKVLQYFLYNTFDEDLMNAFNSKYALVRKEILNQVYLQPFASRYIAQFATFLSENRGHYMVENIIEDGLNDFIVTHLYKYREAWTTPLHFVGGTAYAFKDVLKELCNSYELEVGIILKEPIEALAKYHQTA